MLSATLSMLAWTLHGEQGQRAEAAASAASAQCQKALAVAALTCWRTFVRERRAATEAFHRAAQRRMAQRLRSGFVEWRALLQVLTPPSCCQKPCDERSAYRLGASSSRRSCPTPGSKFDPSLHPTSCLGTRDPYSSGK